VQKRTKKKREKKGKQGESKVLLKVAHCIGKIDGPME
jgi:hypothetical protein